jgi:hypothetical protein
MGAAKNRADNGPTDYFPSTLFSREAPGAIEMEYVTAHEVGHALANILLDYPIEFTSVTSHLDNRIEGFTKNTNEGKSAAEVALRGHNRERALQLAAIQFAEPLAEFRARTRALFRNGRIVHRCSRRKSDGVQNVPLRERNRRQSYVANQNRRF